MRVAGDTFLSNTESDIIPLFSFFSNLDSRFSISGQGSLRIETVKEEDSGTYTCRATNMEDSEDAVATLTVHGNENILRPF